MLYENLFLPNVVERKKGSATDLSRKGKLRIFQEAVGEDDEFAHEDGEGEFLGLTVGEESLIEGLQDGVKA